MYDPGMHAAMAAAAAAAGVDVDDLVGSVSGLGYSAPSNRYASDVGGHSSSSGFVDDPYRAGYVAWPAA